MIFQSCVLYKSKLLIALNSLTKSDLDKFELFINSPFFNRDQHIILFYNEVLNVIIAQKKLDKLLIFEKLFPGQNYSDTKIRLLQSNLFKLLEQFIKYKMTLSGPSIYPELKLLDYYRSKKIEKCKNSQYLKLERQISEQLVDEDPYYLYELDLLDEHIKDFASQKSIKPNLLQEFYDKTQEATLLMILKTACRLFTEKSVFNYTFDVGILPEILPWIKENREKCSPQIRLYFAYFNMINDSEEEQHYIDFQALLAEYYYLFESQELRDLYLAANNYCIRKLNQGHREYELQALNNYRSALDNKVLFENGRLSQRTYNNIVALALKSNQLEWASQFMEDYTSSLAAHEQVSSYNLNKARLAYVQKDFERGLELLQGADFKPMLNNLSAKTLMIKLFYEMGEYDVLYYQLKAMRAFLYRNKVIGYHKKAFINLIRYTEKLLRLRPDDQHKMEKVKTDILNEDIIWEKDWLLNQLIDK